MSYELRREEPLADGIRRIVVEQVDIAIRVLSHPQCNGGVDEAVHEARKSFKRVRSALRLARGVVGNESYHRESVRFRILAGALASLRESAVSVLSIDELREDVAPELRPGAFSELRAHLVERHTVALWQTVEREEALIRVTGRLRNARRQLRDLPTRDCSDLAWTPGVRRAYRDGANRMAEASREHALDAFHGWRKKAKHLRYHLDVLRGSWSGQLYRAAELLHELTDLLGVHHDLADLRRQLERNPATRATSRRRSEARALFRLIDEKRVALESEGREVGERLYSAQAKVVVEQLVSRWNQWRRPH